MVRRLPLLETPPLWPVHSPACPLRDQNEARLDVGAAPEPPREDRPQAIPDALGGGTPDADRTPQSPHIPVDASQGTATQMANVMEHKR